MSEDLPVDVMPCSNDEYFPPPPSVAQRAIMDLASRETERVRSRFGMTRAQFVRTAAATAIGFWAVDLVRMGRFGSYGYAQAGMKRPDACDLEWAGRKGLETLRNLPGEFIFDVQSHHVDPDGMWRVSQPGLRGLLQRRLAAGARGRRGRPDPEPVALSLPEGGLPRLGDDDVGALGRADLAGHQQPAAAGRGGRDGAHGQRPGAARGAASCTPS